LRTLGQHREALHELDAALNLVRKTGTFNVLLEFLEYDRSIVLAALGDASGARASYRRYLRLVGAWNRNAQASSDDGVPATASKRPLEPFLLKRADRFILEHIGEAFPVDRLAEHCGVSLRTLEKTFTDFRGLTPVAHIRNVRLEQVHRALKGDVGVAAVAKRYGFRSPTTFAVEYRKRFGTTPSRTKRAALN
jgi:transcriptional regulator GlxA family with amidase domain